MRTTLRGLVVQLLAALVLGTATLLVMKREPRTHWAIPPANVITIASRTNFSADLLRGAGFRFELHLVGSKVAL